MNSRAGGKRCTSVEDDEGVAAGQAGARVGLEVHEERVDVRAVHAEQVLYVLGRLGEVDDEVAGVLVLRERAGECALPRAPGPLQQERAAPPGTLLQDRSFSYALRLNMPPPRPSGCAARNGNSV